MPAWPSVPLSAWGRRVWVPRRGSGLVVPVVPAVRADRLGRGGQVDPLDPESVRGPQVPVPGLRTRAGP